MHEYYILNESIYNFNGNESSMSEYYSLTNDLGSCTILSCAIEAEDNYLCTEHFTLCVKDNDTTKTANIKIVVLRAWHIFTRTRTIIAMLNLK